MYHIVKFEQNHEYGPKLSWNYTKFWAFWQKGVFKTIFDEALTPFLKMFLLRQILVYLSQVSVAETFVNY